MKPRWPVVALLLLFVGMLGIRREVGEPGGFFNVLPPGQDGVLSEIEAVQLPSLPPHMTDQLAMYGDLVYDEATPGMTLQKLLTYFKRAPIAEPAGSLERQYHPGGRLDVSVRRDAAFGVPHISGSTREGVMFASGYAEAEDRLFLMDVLRHLGRARLSEFLGASEGNLELDCEQLGVAPYEEADLSAQVAALAAAHPDVGVDGQAFIDGVNQYVAEALIDSNKRPVEYLALQQVLEPFVREDVVAIASLVGGIFGKGGGRELENFCGIHQLAAQLGGDAATARAIFDDLKFADDPEAPTTVPAGAGSFPYMSDLATPFPPDPSVNPDIDCASLQDLSPPPGLVPIPDKVVVSCKSPGGLLGGFELPRGLSNAMLIGAARASPRRPIAVFGPQTSYFMPQLLVEKAVQGPGIYARGVAFAGTGIYVQLGRGRNYAWSATSAGGDNVDQVVLRLCEPAGGSATPASLGYFHDGACKALHVHDQTYLAKPSAAGLPASVLVREYWERATEIGAILVKRGSLTDGTPIAIADRRSTYMAELDSARGFRQINDPNFMQQGYDRFRQAMGSGIDYTFNWFYVDEKDIGYQHSCKCPQRAQGVDPYLPAWATGPHDWQGFIPASAQPFVKNPAQGFLSSWNNKQAAGFRSNDGNFGYGPLYRSLLLDRRIQRAIAPGPVGIGGAVDIMELAGTTDLRAQELIPLLERSMGAVSPSADARVQQMYDILVDWATHDDFGHRRDHDRDGAYDRAQAAAIIDAWWPLLVDSIFQVSDTQGADVRLRELFGLSADDSNRTNHLGSAFQGGMYPHVQKDLRQVIEDSLGGDPVAGRLSRTYCGAGVLADCRTALWSSLETAIPDLETKYGSTQVSDWNFDPADEDVRHSAVGIAGTAAAPVPAIHWINRPTFQQVVQVGTSAPGP